MLVGTELVLLRVALPFWFGTEPALLQVALPFRHGRASVALSLRWIFLQGFGCSVRIEVLPFFSCWTSG